MAPESPDVLSSLHRLRPLKEHATQGGLFLDLDGTLCHLVDAPDKVVLPPETRDRLRLLSRRYGLVAIVSGREAAALARIVDLPELAYVGNHGLEIIEDGSRRVLLPDYVAARMRQLGEELASLDIEGTLLELKELSHAIHYRTAPDPTLARDRILEALERIDLDGARIMEGKMLVQVRPDFPLDKGRAVETLVAERALEYLLYAGDDTTDLDAFRSVTALQREGKVLAFKVVVVHGDTPASLREQADFEAEGVEAVAELLAWLAVPEGA